MWDPQHLTILYDYTACYGDSFTILYIDDIRASQATQVWVSTACYGNRFTFLRYAHLAHANVTSRLDTPIYIYIYVCVCLTK
jgi:hypothetical protein